MPIDPVRPRTKVIAVPRYRRRSAARSSGVTSGVTPNQRAKPGTAWCRSMPSPSTIAQPALGGGGEQRRFERAHRRHRRRPPCAAARRKIEAQRRLAHHAERGGVDDEIDVGHARPPRPRQATASSAGRLAEGPRSRTQVRGPAPRCGWRPGCARSARSCRPATTARAAPPAPSTSAVSDPALPAGAEAMVEMGHEAQTRRCCRRRARRPRTRAC